MTLRSAALVGSELILWTRSRGRWFAALGAVGFVFAVVAVAWGAPTPADGSAPLVLARLTDGNSLGGRLAPFGVLAAVVLAPASGARRRQSFDAVVVLQPGPVRGPMAVATAQGLVWLGGLMALMVGGGGALTLGATIAGGSPLATLPTAAGVVSVLLRFLAVGAVAGLAWAFGWWFRWGPVGASLALMAITLGLGSLVSGALLTPGGVLGAALELLMRGGPLGTAMSGTWPTWTAGPNGPAVAVVSVVAVVATGAAWAVDRHVMPSPYDGT